MKKATVYIWARALENFGIFYEPNACSDVESNTYQKKLWQNELQAACIWVILEVTEMGWCIAKNILKKPLDPPMAMLPINVYRASLETNA